MQRFLAILVAVLILAGAAGYLVLERQHAAEIERITAETHARLAQVRQEQEQVIRGLGQDLATTLAVLLADEIARGNLALVEARLTPIVQGQRVAGILVVDQAGQVLAATDLRYRGRTLDDGATRQAIAVENVVVAESPPAPGQLEIDAPVFSSGQRVATVRLFLDLK